MEAQEIWQKPEHSQRFKHNATIQAKPTIQVFKSKSSGHFFGVYALSHITAIVVPAALMLAC